MVHQNKVALWIALFIGLCILEGCSTVGHHMEITGYKAQSAITRMTYKPGESLLASVEETKLKHQCKGNPALLVESTELKPIKITPGQEIVARLIYASCYGTGLNGTIVRRIVYKGKTLIELPEDVEYKPGTWALTAYLGIPPEAEPGGYILETEIRTKPHTLRESNSFQVLKE